MFLQRFLGAAERFRWYWRVFFELYLNVLARGAWRAGFGPLARGAKLEGEQGAQSGREMNSKYEQILWQRLFLALLLWPANEPKSLELSSISHQ